MASFTPLRACVSLQFLSQAAEEVSCCCLLNTPPLQDNQVACPLVLPFHCWDQLGIFWFALLLPQLNEMSDIVDDIAESKRQIEKSEQALTPQKSMPAKVSPRKLSPLKAAAATASTPSPVKVRTPTRARPSPTQAANHTPSPPKQVCSKRSAHPCLHPWPTLLPCLNTSKPPPLILHYSSVSFGSFMNYYISFFFFLYVTSPICASSTLKYMCSPCLVFVMQCELPVEWKC